jgi:BirA family biotin operon repressor/biotin-[acetyl-CoA-carboxylase] ligase
MASSLAQVLGHPVRRAELAVQVILALNRMYAAFPQNKGEYLEKYRADCMTPGHQVQLVTPASRQEAYAVSIDDDFRLVVELPDGTRKALSAGEVSVRGMYGYV